MRTPAIRAHGRGTRPPDAGLASQMVLHLGMRIAPANLLISATFSASAPRAEQLRSRVISLAERAPSRGAFLAGLEDIARAERVVLEMGQVDGDEVAFYLWEAADGA